MNAAATNGPAMTDRSDALEQAHSHVQRAAPRPQRRRRWARDDGSIVVMVPSLAVGMMALAGLVVDGGTALAAHGRAADVAQQAARAAADALDPTSVRQARPARLVANPAAARAAANRVLDVGAVSGTVTVSGDTITVLATVRKRTAILSAIGVNTVQGTATATATVLYGGTTEGR